MDADKAVAMLMQIREVVNKTERNIHDHEARGVFNNALDVLDFERRVNADAYVAIRNIIHGV